MARLACLLAVLALAAFVRLDALGRPSTFVADEGFYARDACVYAGKPAHVCGVSAEQTPEHPPLGKWLIALGIRVFGFDPSGWRTASALAGIATVGLLFWLGLRLLRSTMAATLAAGLLAVEPLDVVVTMCGVSAVLFCVRDRDAASARLLPPWRLAAGAAAGAAGASKWSG